MSNCGLLVVFRATPGINGAISPTVPVRQRTVGSRLRLAAKSVEVAFAHFFCVKRINGVEIRHTARSHRGEP